MVDKALFVGTGGARESMRQLEVITNNLANAGTIGFRADFESKKSVATASSGDQTRVYSVVDKTYSDFRPGPIINTGRSLDVAISGDGFIAVQGLDGAEGYTRAGNLQIKNNRLTTQSGELLIGSNGIVALPNQTERVTIGADGTVTAKIIGQKDLVILNRIKLTNPDIKTLRKGTDGLFYMTGDTSISPRSDKVQLVSGALENSNVNTVQTLTDLIELSRNFEFHTNLMKTIQELATRSNGLLELPK